MNGMQSTCLLVEILNNKSQFFDFIKFSTDFLYPIKSFVFQEIFASHGVYKDSERGQGPGGSMLANGFDSDWVVNDKFEVDPKKYLVRPIHL